MSYWALKEKLASGGQAEIWLVEDVALRTEAVSKRLFPARWDQDRAEELRRFQREVRTQRQLSEAHKGIMPIIAEAFQCDPPFYIMPRASVVLRDLISPGSGMTPGVTTSILLTVCSAVGYAHTRGVLHRDLKPENILKLHRSGWVVGDFGLCRDLTTGSTTFTQTHVGFGTFAYMAPEQYDNAHEVGPEADVFSLGRILYHMLTGRSPAPYQHLDLLPAEFRDLVAVATAELPSDRFASVAEFSRELTRAAPPKWIALQVASEKLADKLGLETRAGRPVPDAALSSVELSVSSDRQVAASDLAVLNDLRHHVLDLRGPEVAMDAAI
jgi:eukaryotic-like serine/threonine-protein kinase